jgi:hypothetical protein
MPGCNVSAKRLSHIRGNIDASRHNWKPLLRRGKRNGVPGTVAAWRSQMRGFEKTGLAECRVRPAIADRQCDSGCGNQRSSLWKK